MYQSSVLRKPYFFPLKDSNADSETQKISVYSSYRCAFLETPGNFFPPKTRTKAA